MPLEAQVIIVHIFTVPTTSSRPSIEIVGCIHVCMYFSMSLPWQDRIRLRGRTWPKGVKIYCRRTPRVLEF